MTISLSGFMNSRLSAAAWAGVMVSATFFFAVVLGAFSIVSEEEQGGQTLGLRPRFVSLVQSLSQTLQVRVSFGIV